MDVLALILALVAMVIFLLCAHAQAKGVGTRKPWINQSLGLAFFVAAMIAQFTTVIDSHGPVNW